MTDVAFPFSLVLACTKTGQCPLQAHKHDENKPHREKWWLESCFQYRWLFEVSLTRFEWVAKWHFGYLLLCCVNRSSFLFDYSSNKRSISTLLCVVGRYQNYQQESISPSKSWPELTTSIPTGLGMLILACSRKFSMSGFVDTWPQKLLFMYSLIPFRPRGCYLPFLKLTPHPL